VRSFGRGVCRQRVRLAVLLLPRRVQSVPARAVPAAREAARKIERLHNALAVHLLLRSHLNERGITDAPETYERLSGLGRHWPKAASRFRRLLRRQARHPGLPRLAPQRTHSGNDPHDVVLPGDGTLNAEFGENLLDDVTVLEGQAAARSAAGWNDMPTARARRRPNHAPSAPSRTTPGTIMTPAQWRSECASSSTRQMFPGSEAAGVTLLFDTLALYKGYT